MRRQRGFTLIELLIVVAIIGIIAAIAIPNLLNAINRGRQKRTMADMRTIATAVESYSVDFNFYPKVAGPGVVTLLDAHITPTYVRKLPVEDGWKNNMIWAGDDQGSSYTVVSGGKVPPGTTVATDATGCGAIGTQTTNFAADICYSLGQFVQWPEGMQTD